MMDAVKLIVIFTLIVLALHKKLSVGVTLFGAGLLTALLFSVPTSRLLDGYWELITSRRFISLTAVICQITMLGAILKELGFLQKLSESCRGLIGGRKTAVAAMPPLVGMMPMPGGSLLSAPLVDNVLSESRYAPHFKCAANYYFRHVIEHFWPIYPGIIITEAITTVPVASLALLYSPLAVIMLIIGYFAFIRQIENHSGERRGLLRTMAGILSATWPIVLAIVIYGLFKVELAIAIAVSFVALLVVARPPRASVVRALKKGLSYKLIFLIFGILSFQTCLDLSGAIGSLQQLSIDYNLPPELIIIVVCFASGLLTGMYAAYVALSYTLLAGFLYQPVINPSHIFLAMLSGYIGMMLSPTHLCLIVTNEYFHSDLLKVYRCIVIPFLILGLAGFLIYLSGWGDWIFS